MREQHTQEWAASEGRPYKGNERWRDRPLLQRPVAPTMVDYLGSGGRARNTRSSMGTVGVRTVEVFPSARAICFARALSAGAAGFAESGGASPGCMEMRVVLGAQFGVFRQVSRRKTWRSPLLGVVVDGAVCGFAADDCESWPGVMATNAT
jgi:hypothetical protein